MVFKPLLLSSALLVLLPGVGFCATLGSWHANPLSNASDCAMLDVSCCTSTPHSQTKGSTAVPPPKTSGCHAKAQRVWTKSSTVLCDALCIVQINYGCNYPVGPFHLADSSYSLPASLLEFVQACAAPIHIQEAANPQLGFVLGVCFPPVLYVLKSGACTQPQSIIWRQSFCF